MMENVYYVYAYLDPRKPGSFNYGDHIFDYEPFYIGKGKDGRILDHMQPSGLRRANTLKNNKIMSIIEETGNKPLYKKILENLTEDIAYEKEIEFIKHFGRIDNRTGILANHTDGGPLGKNPINNGFRGQKHKPSTIEYLKKFHRGNQKSESWKKSRSDTLKGKSFQEQGIIISTESREKAIERSKTVKTLNRLAYCKTFMFVDPMGEKLIVNDLCSFCATNHIEYTSLIMVHSGKLLHYKGYRKYINNDSLIPYERRGVKTYKFIKDCKIVETDNLKRFCKENNLLYTVMVSVNSGKYNNHRGYTKFYE